MRRPHAVDQGARRTLVESGSRVAHGPLMSRLRRARVCIDVCWRGFAGRRIRWRAAATSCLRWCRTRSPRAARKQLVAAVAVPPAWGASTSYFLPVGLPGRQADIEQLLPAALNQEFLVLHVRNENANSIPRFIKKFILQKKVTFFTH